jgi:DNA-binding XRE family transcriptional regulator
LNSEFTIEYVELPNGRAPARDFVDSLDDKAAARIDAFIERLRIYGNRMQGKFVKKLTGDIFELRVKQFDRIFRGLFFEGAGTMKRDKHSEIVEQRARKSATYRKTFGRTLHQIDLALLVREMREVAGLTQAELAKKVGTTQSVIARLEDAEYAGHSLTMLERIAAVCGIALKLHAEKKPNFDREVALV